MFMKKITKLLVGTNNKGKLREIKDLLPKNLEIYCQSDFNIKRPAENGSTFEENSFIKAKYFSKKTKMICLSDDSGLMIDLLKGKPGIFSARWGGKNSNFKLAINKVFRELYKANKDWKKKKIKAKFICALTIFWPNKKVIRSIGKIKGYISTRAKGKNGFGYDPIFIPFNKKLTFAQMKPYEKYKIDHRFKAFKKIKKFF